MDHSFSWGSRSLLLAWRTQEIGRGRGSAKIYPPEEAASAVVELGSIGAPINRIDKAIAVDSGPYILKPIQFYPKLPRPSTPGEAKRIPSNIRQNRNEHFRARQLSRNSHVAISASGDHVFLSSSELLALREAPGTLSLQLQALLQSKFILLAQPEGKGSARLLLSRQATKRTIANQGPTLHIIVPTLQCGHSCQYCQVSRSLDDDGHTMSIADLNAACDAVFQSPSSTLTVEFQGGDPLLRFDLVKHAILRISERNVAAERNVRFVVASTLHQLTQEMCAFFRQYGVLLSTSIDGPAALHNRNRPTPTRDAYERTVGGIQLARRELGVHSVSALMTTTRASLGHANAIVDEYVLLGFSEIFLRPLSSYGFAKRNLQRMGYDIEEFAKFYTAALDRVLWWCDKGVILREVYASILLNKMLSTFDSGYVDLQSPTGAGSSVLVYNYDGYIYPSDEARMLAEDGDHTLRLGRIIDLTVDVHRHPVINELRHASEPEKIEGCRECAFHEFCGPNPVDAYAQHGSMFAPVQTTEHCQRHLWLFDAMYKRLRDANKASVDRFYQWACPVAEHSSCA